MSFFKPINQPVFKWEKNLKLIAKILLSNYASISRGCASNYEIYLTVETISCYHLCEWCCTTTCHIRLYSCRTHRMTKHLNLTPHEHIHVNLYYTNGNSIDSKSKGQQKKVSELFWDVKIRKKNPKTDWCVGGWLRLFHAYEFPLGFRMWIFCSSLLQDGLDKSTNWSFDDIITIQINLIFKIIILSILLSNQFDLNNNFIYTDLLKSLKLLNLLSKVCG